MSLFSTRRFASACVLSAAVSAALIAPGAASALGGEQCSGVDVEGKGASLQKLSQIETWAPEFKNPADTNAAACSGSQGSKGVRTVTYTSTGSGAGLRSWGQEPKEASEINFGPKNAYIGTDEPPNLKQKEEMESHGVAGAVLTIPVEQAAVTVSVHLPEGCTVEGGPVPGRLGLKWTVVEKIFRGKDTKWSQVLNKAKLVGAGCPKTAKTSHITRVVRKDGSGTTSLFKKWLNVVYKKEVEPGKTWQQLAESANNTTWPEEAADPIIKGEGNGGVATEVAKNAGSIGYINLADARANKSFTPPIGGAGTPTFWANVENASKPTTTYSDPSTNGDVAEKANSNCEETLYVNGKKKFPPPSTEEVWNEVTAGKVQKNYPICGFTYDLGLTKYSAFTIAKGSKEEPTEKEVRTVFDYYKFVLATGVGGGQTLIGANKDYLGLPTSAEAKANVLKIAQEGAAKVNF
jgi:ABC-type phosphate transport system substrate-binding protein